MFERYGICANESTIPTKPVQPTRLQRQPADGGVLHGDRRFRVSPLSPLLGAAVELRGGRHPFADCRLSLHPALLNDHWHVVSLLAPLAEPFAAARDWL